MNKSAIQKYAIWARNELIEQVKQRAFQYGISETGFGDENASIVAGRVLSSDEKRQRKQFIEVIKRSTYQQTIEEVAYTWFNRFIALRYMEVNDYLPTHVRVFSDASGIFKPEILSNVLHIDLPGLDKDKVSEFLNSNQTQELYRYLLLTQCNALNELLPEMFERLGAYTEILLPNNILKPESIIGRLVNDIPEEDFKDAVQIIGWMYQYYNTEPKQDVFNGFSRNVKVTREKIPAATQLFTPDWIVRYMVENTLGRLWLVTHPNSSLSKEWKYYIEDAEQAREIKEKVSLLDFENTVQSPEEIKFIDPCMGSGHILVYAFDVLMQIYISEGYSEREAVQYILEKNLFGLDIDRRAYQLAYFALMMKARQYNRRILTSGIKPQVYEPTGYLIGMELGSLIRVDELEQKPEESKDYQNNLFDEEYETKLNTWNFRRLLAQKYDVVVTNPPYMKFDNMSENLMEFVTKYCKCAKYDLYSAFIFKSYELVKKCGYVSMITMHNFMFSPSFEEMRDVIKEWSWINMLHLGSRAFSEITGEVVQTTSFVISKNDFKSEMNVIDVTYIKTPEGKEIEFLNKKEKPIKFNLSKINFIPAHAFGYALSDNIIELFKKEKFLSNISVSKAGIVTGEDDVFVRLWFEVAHDEITYSPELGKLYKYVLFSRGGAFNRWYGNSQHVLKLNDLWDNSKTNKSVRRGDPNYYFKRGIGWSQMAGGTCKDFSEITNALCKTTTPMLYVNEQDKYNYVLAYLNSPIPPIILKSLNPTLSILTSDIMNLPFLYDASKKTEIDNLVNICLVSSKKIYSEQEENWQFERHSLINRQGRLSDCYSKWRQNEIEILNEIYDSEKRINSIFLNIFGIETDFKEYENEIPYNGMEIKEVMKRLISFSIGCIFGRYSLDIDGLVYAGGEWDMSKYQKFPVDKDNIIPILDDEYFEDDIVGRFVTFIKTVYGEDSLEENLKFITDALGGRGTSREIIRNYFLNDFYADHLKIYQKRPIYWLFDSGKKNGFKALIYMHRYSRDLLAKLRTEYVHEQQERYRTQLSRISSELNHALGSERSNLLKQQDKLTEQLKEITTFEEKVHHLADQHIEIDLDDGVKKNYALFEDVLAKI